MKENNGLFTVKRLLRKVFPAVAALFCTVILSACGATVNTTLDANADFKGTRTITAVLSSGDLNEYVNGGADAIEKVVKKIDKDRVSAMIYMLWYVNKFVKELDNSDYETCVFIN